MSLGERNSTGRQTEIVMLSRSASGIGVKRDPELLDRLADRFRWIVQGRSPVKFMGKALGLIHECNAIQRARRGAWAIATF
jgi:hypothetical protein